MLRSPFQSPQFKVCLVIVTLGLLFVFGLSSRNWIDYLRTGSWVETTGTIREVRLAGPGGNLVAIRESDFPIGFGSRLICEYDYEFAGANFSGDRIGVASFETKAIQNRHCEALLKAIDEQGGQVTILVDPETPENSAIFRGIDTGMIGYPLATIAWLGLLAFFYRRTRDDGAGVRNAKAPGRPQTELPQPSIEEGIRGSVAG